MAFLLLSDLRYTIKSMRFAKKSGPLAFLLLCGGVAGYALFGPSALFAQISGDGVPPVLSNIQILGIGATSTTLTWDTDENADSEVNFGLTKDYGVARDSTPDKTKHSVTLIELEPSTKYHLRIGSADEGGNQA